MKKAAQGFEIKMEELESTLEKISAEDVSLEESIALYAKSAKLIQEANVILNTARLKMQEIDQLLEAEINSEIGK